MTSERFDVLVAEAEQYARRHPVAYRIRLGLLAAFGYAYIWLVLAVIVALLALLVWWLTQSPSGFAINALIKIGWPLALVAYAIGRALWVRFPRPDGVEVGRREASRLFALVDELRRQLACPRFHHILLTDEWNAGVTQRPRLGPFGWYENYLQLGVPLMSGLAPDEFRAVLAHEFGHLSRSHGRFGSWIYRIRATWGRLLEGLHQTRHRWRGIFELFLERFAPYFNAYSFVLARAREYEADRVAADIVGRETTGRALVNLALGDMLLARQYWPSVTRLTREREDPPDGVVSRMVAVLRAGPPVEALPGWSEEALSRKTGTEDTHPSLSERLAALGLAPSDVRPSGGMETRSAADELLEGIGGSTLARLDAGWHDQVLPAWRGQYAAAQQARARLQAIEERIATGPLSPDLTWERVALTLDLHGDSAAEPLLSDVLGANADHAGANFVLGRILLERKDGAGLEHLERAMRRDPGCIPLGCALAAAFHEAAGRQTEAAEFRARGRAGSDLLNQAEAERRGVDGGDAFVSHGLTATEVDRLRQEIAGFFDVTRAYLVRKAVRYLPERPYYVVGVEVGRWYRFVGARDVREVVHGLATKVAWPGQTWIVALNRRNRKLARKIRRTPEAELLKR
jgi:Zn-dependent protease with chaperone function